MIKCEIPEKADVYNACNVYGLLKHISLLLVVPMLSFQIHELVIKTNMLLSLFLKLQVFVAIVSELGKMPMYCLLALLFEFNTNNKKIRNTMNRTIRYRSTGWKIKKLLFGFNKLYQIIYHLCMVKKY